MSGNLVGGSGAFAFAIASAKADAVRWRSLRFALTPLANRFGSVRRSLDPMVGIDQVTASDRDRMLQS
jgi:hypothetical protein